jgi:hypothetical protein
MPRRFSGIHLRGTAVITKIFIAGLSEPLVLSDGKNNRGWKRLVRQQLKSISDRLITAAQNHLPDPSEGFLWPESENLWNLEWTAAASDCANGMEAELFGRLEWWEREVQGNGEELAAATSPAPLDRTEE